MQQYYELIRRYQQPGFKYNQPLGAATTPMANQNLSWKITYRYYERLNELYSAKYGPNRYQTYLKKGWAGQTASPLPGVGLICKNKQALRNLWKKLATDI